MPLDRENITIASRRMLPTYVVLAAYLGTVYLLDPQGRLGRAPGLALARYLAPMEVWGVLFLGFAALMLLAIHRKERRLFVFALYAYQYAAVLWAGIYLGACFISPDASFGGPAWPLFVAVACRASRDSLRQQEV